jgi:hypothetical protein
MSGKVSVDIAALREGARALKGLPEAPARAKVMMGDLGSSRTDAAFERYYSTWTSECSAAVQSVEKLSTILRSSAETYVRRDEEAADGFGGGAHAF